MESVIDTVIVFPDRAKIQRIGQCELAVGEHWLTFDNLPLTLLEDSIRATGKGSAQAQLLSVGVKRIYFSQTPATAARELQDKLAALENARAAQQGRLQVLQRESQSMSNIANQGDVFARGLALRGQNIAEQAAVFDFLRQRQIALHDEMLQQQNGIKATEREMQQVQNQLDQLQQVQPTERNQVSLQVYVKQAGTLGITLQYVVVGASWQPSYDLRVQDDGVAVTYLAAVQQQTGEDWQQVALTLSTAQPALSLNTPELSPWWVQLAPPPPPPRHKMARAMGGALEELAPMPAMAPIMAAADAAPEMVMAKPNASVTDSGPALTYQLAGKANVASAAEQHKVTIAQFNWNATFDYVCAPRIAEACYRRAKVTNGSPYTLLPGNALLFANDDFIGNVSLTKTVPQQELELFLGVDERITVKRTEVLHDVDKTLLGDKRRTRFGYQIQLDNLTKQPQRVLVREQIPLSRTEQIKVKLESSEPRLTEQTDLGYLHWQLTLPAAASQKLRFEFTVEQPRSSDVIGI